MKINLTTGQKFLVVSFCFSLAVIGFMVKLTRDFRQIDKELHAAFYFLAAALLNILFAGRNIIKHAIVFSILFLYGTAIEYGQQFSNRFYRKRIHGRFDPEDIQANIKGLIAFSILWLLVTVVVNLYKTVSTERPGN